MWQRSFCRLRQAWGGLSRWKRAVATAIGLCLLFQLAFAWILWREAQLRQQLAGKATLYLGKSPLSLNVQMALGRFVSPERLQLLAPIEAAMITQPTHDDLLLITRLNIKCLSIQSENHTAIELQPISSISQLEALELDGDCVEANALAPLADCRKLRRLRIGGRLTPEALRPLRHCVSLVELHVYAGESDGAFDPITESHLAEVARIPNLRRLTIDSPGMAGTALGSLAGAQRLEELFVYQANLQNVSPDGLGQMPQLKLLFLSLGNSYYVEPLRGFPALSTLVVDGARISPQFLSSLRWLPHLDTLSFRWCRVDDSLSGLANNSKLKRLNLDRCDTSVDGIRSIGRLSSLEVLDTHEFEEFKEFGDLFPRLQPTSDFVDWDFGLDKETWVYGVPSGGGGFY